MRGGRLALGAAAVAGVLWGLWGLTGPAGQLGERVVIAGRAPPHPSPLGQPSGGDGSSVAAFLDRYAPPAQPSASAALPGPVAISVVAPQALLVGETQDIVVHVGPNHGIGEIGLTLQFDGELLQVRAGADGAWMAGASAPPRFVAGIADTEDSVLIRSEPLDRRAGRAGGPLAVVQVQAMATGATQVLVRDVSVRGVDGRPLAFTLASSSPAVVVESARPEAAPWRAAPPPVMPAMASDVGEEGD